MNSLHTEQSLILKQTLSQQMIQSVEILQMSGQELTDYLKEMALENPMADLSDAEPEDEEKVRLKKLEWLAALDEQNRAYYSYDSEEDDDRGRLANVSVRRGETLTDLLHLQLLSGHYSTKEMAVFDFIIGSLDDRGFFTMSLEQLADTFGISVSEADTYLDVMRNLDPPGVCTNGPKDCLLCQMNKMEKADWDIERAIVRDYFEQLGKNHLPQIAQKLGVTLDRIVEALENIRTLNPIPAQGFDSVEVPHYIKPDITIVRFADHFEILLNKFQYPRVSVNPYYLKLLRSEGDSPVCDEETRKYLNEKLRQIEQVKENIARRDSTLMALAKYLLEYQEAFFLNGENALRPMRMKDAAAQMQVHESTVSRAVREKYLQCSWGLFPLSYFFNAGVAGEEEEIATRKVKAALKRLVEEEDPRKPKSDQKLSELLQEAGMPISRRTVAKYREEMGIGSTRERKAWK